MVPFRWVYLVTTGPHVPFSVELSVQSIESMPKTVELRSIQNENYANLHDFRMIIAILCGALVSNTLCVFCRVQSSHVLDLTIYQKLAV